VIRTPIQTGIDALLSLFYPERCQICHLAHATPARGWVCDGCRDQVIPVCKPACEKCGLPFPGEITGQFECPNCIDRKFAFSRARSAVQATGVARDAIHLYKYHRAFWLEPFFRDFWIPAAQADLCTQSWDGIVPVPLHPVREREREFNQAERLARTLGESLRLPVHAGLIRRAESTSSQTRLTREERAANVRRAFKPTRDQRLANTRWIVVDDVLTTGATTDGVARVLRQMGASEVVVWTFARGV
jgi:ComF family protein